jgi:hypothetical protein
LQAAAFTLGCLFSADAAATDVAELTNIEGRLTHYLADLLITLGRERDQVWGWHWNTALALELDEVR